MKVTVTSLSEQVVVLSRRVLLRLLLRRRATVASTRVLIGSRGLTVRSVMGLISKKLEHEFPAEIMASSYAFIGIAQQAER